MEKPVCKCNYEGHQLIVYDNRLVAAHLKENGSLDGNAAEKEFFFVEMDAIKLFQEQNAIYLCFVSAVETPACSLEENPYVIKLPVHMYEAAAALYDYIEVRIEKAQKYSAEVLYSSKEMNEAPEMKILCERLAAIAQRKQISSASMLLTKTEAQEKLKKYQQKDKTFLLSSGISAGIFIMMLVGVIIYALR